MKDKLGKKKTNCFSYRNRACSIDVLWGIAF